MTDIYGDGDDGEEMITVDMVLDGTYLFETDFPNHVYAAILKDPDSRSVTLHLPDGPVDCKYDRLEGFVVHLTVLH